MSVKHVLESHVVGGKSCPLAEFSEKWSKRALESGSKMPVFVIVDMSAP